MTTTQSSLPELTSEVEGCFKRNLSAEQLKPHYEHFMALATTIEDDLKEALRRKPKKAKTAAKGKASTDKAKPV